jgi:hypothetical protein
MPPHSDADPARLPAWQEEHADPADGSGVESRQHPCGRHTLIGDHAAVTWMAKLARSLNHWVTPTERICTP